jgi:hypothetical protein
LRTHLTRLRGALVVLLVGSACLFAVGSTIERNHGHHESSTAKSTEVSGKEGGGETGAESAGESSKPSADHHTGEAGSRILGVDTESVGLSVAAFAASLLLAGAIWLLPSTLVLFTIVGFGLVFAAGDGRELVHQLDESNNGLAAVAALLVAVHLAICALAATLLPRRSRPSGSPLPKATS